MFPFVLLAACPAAVFVACELVLNSRWPGLAPYAGCLAAGCCGALALRLAPARAERAVSLGLYRARYAVEGPAGEGAEGLAAAVEAALFAAAHARSAGPGPAPAERMAAAAAAGDAKAAEKAEPREKIEVPFRRVARPPARKTPGAPPANKLTPAAPPPRRPPPSPPAAPGSPGRRVSDGGGGPASFPARPALF